MDIKKDCIPAQLFFSNSLEILFEKLKENLFPPNASPFSKRLVIVPSQAMENWIRMHLAQDLNISAGITTSFLENALHELFVMDQFPSKLELTLHIEYELNQIKERWDLLKRYCKEKRVLGLAKQLASLFARYGIYGHSACSKWEKEPKNWQEDLWSRIFKTWTYPLRMLPNLKTKKCDASIHLFSFSHLPPLYFHFFQQLPSVHFYQLSPCQEFWSDLVPDRKSLYNFDGADFVASEAIRRSAEDEGNLDKLSSPSTEPGGKRCPSKSKDFCGQALASEHPLLTHFGRVGREMARLVEESDIAIEECYQIPDEHTQLHQLQRELLNLETYEKLEDDSLELHISTTEHQEIQNLHKTLIKLLNENSLEPKDILVMAPDIAPYETYIRAIFKDPLAFQIADMPMQQKHPQVEGLFLLLDLEKRRFSAPALLELFSHPLFQKKIGWNEEDLLQIRDWIEKTGIRWGLDGKNRDALLKKSQCERGIEDEGATWKAGIGYLLEELAIPYDPKRIDFTQAELLGEWKQVLDRLAESAMLLQEQLTMRAWTDRLKALHESYFSESETVIHHLENLARAARRLPDRLYSFEKIRQLLQEIIGEKSMTVNANQIQAIRFCSLLPMRAIPAQVICLIGMNHDAFPRQESLFSLDMLKNQGDYTPSRLDFDRYLFLEAILSSRKKLIISYLGCDPYDQTPWPPSSVVAQLLPYISKTVKHPVIVPVKEKRQKNPFLFTYHPKKIEIPSCRINLIDFLRPFRSPLRHYLYHQDIYVREEKVILEEEAFQLSALQKAILRKSGDLAFKKAKREGDFPIGSFGILAKDQLQQEIETIPENLESLPVDLAIGNVQLVGMLEGVMEDGLCLFEKKGMKGAARNWPLFLLLAAIKPDAHVCLFSRDGKTVERFFDDPRPYLQTALRYYFLSREMPTPLFPDWIEPILKEDSKKLENVMHYDASLRWALRGQTPLPAKELICAWKEEAEKLYGEMADAWF